MLKKCLNIILLVTFILGILVSYSSIYRAFSVTPADPTALSVSVTTYQGNVATTYDYMVIAAIVEASGSPVSGALVTFSDSLGSTFLGSTATTNSSGVALTTVQFNSGNTGSDTITANASATGYNSGIGSATVSVLPYGSTQLAIEPSVTNTVATAGSTDVVSGYVVYAGNYYGMYTKPVAGATVTITDTIGSTFSSATILSDNNGFFSSNFTIATVGTSATDLVTFSVSEISYSSSQSTIMLQAAPYSTSYLTVTMNTFFPSATSTTYDYMVIEAEVTAGGVPVSGASLTFSDSLGSTFLGSTAITDSSGVALTTVQFNSGNTGVDVITASASESGYSGGVASNIVSVLPYGSTQLAIEPSVTNTVATAGSTDVVSGYVVYAGNYYGMYTKPVAGATVTFADTFGSIFNVTSVLTGSQGYFSASFTLPGVVSAIDDIIMVSGSEAGYSGSSSALYIEVPAVLSATVSPSSVVMDVVQSHTFTSFVSYGTSPYSYQWYLNGLAVPGAMNATWTFVPSYVGSCTVYVGVTDAANATATSNTATVTINSAPTVSISPSSVTLDVTQSQTFNSTVSGGTSPYTYQWYLNGTAVLGAVGPTWTFAPSSAGSFTVYVNVTDGVGAQAMSNTAAVTASSVTPEFPSSFILPLFMMATLLAALVLKRKRNVRTQSNDHPSYFAPSNARHKRRLHRRNLAHACVMRERNSQTTKPRACASSSPMRN